MTLCVLAVVIPQWLIGVVQVIQHTCQLNTRTVQHPACVTLNTDSHLAPAPLTDLTGGNVQRSGVTNTQQ